MTFWQDAPPATPRFRRPSGSGSGPGPGRRSGPGRRRRRRRVLVVGAAVLTVLALAVVRPGGAPRATASDVATHRRDAGPQPTVVPPVWSRTLPSWAATMLSDDRPTGIVVGDGWVTAVTLTNGERRWEAPLPGVQPFGAVRGDTVLLATGSSFVALDRATGKVRWQLDTPESPGPVAFVGPAGTPPVAVVSTLEGGLVGLDSATGRTRWSVRFAGRVRGTPAADDASGTIATVWQHDALGTDLRLIDGTSGAARWEHRLPVMAGSPVIASGSVVVGAGGGRRDSEVRAFALVDGSARWRTRVPAPFQPDLVPLVDGREVVVVDQLGHVSSLGLAHGSRRWTTDTRALEVHARPVRVGDAVLVGNEVGEVVTLDRADGRVRARRRPAGLPVGLAVAGPVVVVAQRLVERHALQAFAAARIVAPARSRR